MAVDAGETPLKEVIKLVKVTAATWSMTMIKRMQKVLWTSHPDLTRK
jgi:hypothetical protein